IAGYPANCQQCRSPLSWIEGFPCRPGEEVALKQHLESLRTITKGLPNHCPKCKRSRPGRRPTSDDSLEYAKDWAQAMQQYRRCPKCVVVRWERNERKRRKLRRSFVDALTWLLRLILKIVYFLVMLAVIYKAINFLQPPQ